MSIKVTKKCLHNTLEPNLHSKRPFFYENKTQQNLDLHFKVLILSYLGFFFYFQDF